MLSKKKAERLLRQSVESGEVVSELHDELLRQSVEHGELAPEAVPAARIQHAWERFEARRIGAGVMVGKVLANALAMIRLVFQEARRQRRAHAAPSGWLVSLPALWVPRLLGLVGAAVGVAWILYAPDTTPPTMEVRVQQVEAEDTEVPEWLTAGQQEDGGIIAKKMPSRRMKGQQAPPCEPPPGGQVEMQGACWAPVSVPSPCGQFYEGEDGKCYAPILEKKRMPTSVEP